MDAMDDLKKKEEDSKNTDEAQLEEENKVTELL
jgi:hypothetical protein